MDNETLVQITPEPTDNQKIISLLTEIRDLFKSVITGPSTVDVTVSNTVEVTGSVTPYDPR